MPALLSLGKVVGVILILSTGNLLLAGALYWLYNKYKKAEEEKAQLQERG